MKNKVISLRVSQAEYAAIKEKADKDNVSISRYLVDRAFAEDNLSTHTKQKIYYSLYRIKEYAKENNTLNQMLTKECDTIWLLLK